MTDFQKDLMNGLAFITGIIGFMSGEFISNTWLCRVRLTSTVLLRSSTCFGRFS